MGVLVRDTVVSELISCLPRFLLPTHMLVIGSICAEVGLSGLQFASCLRKCQANQGA